MRCLVDSCASHIHAKTILCFFLWSLLKISPCHCSSRIFSCGSLRAFQNEFSEVFRNLHCIAESICNSNFFCAFFKGFIEFLVFQIDVKILPAFVHCRTLAVSSAQCCCSFCWDFFDVPDQISGHTFSGLHVARIYVNLPPGPRVSMME